MSDKSETPRTDAETLLPKNYPDDPVMYARLVSASFARQLERDLAAAEAVIAQVDVDDLVYQGRILERYEDPRLNPLSEQNFRSYDSARRKIWIVDRVIRAYREGK